MWWVLSALLVVIVWVLKYILGFPIWIPEAVTAFLFLLCVALFLWRRVRAGQAANALERAIAQQGAQQALNARPERRAEIQELQKQVQGGITALKTSKLGGKKGGASALYRLPWYVIIGPPGAGKTTALKASGLVFPYADSSGGGVRGVGGTRNCDWWFTNEAILLDTAGRYTTESDDHDEWIAFLQMLRKYRTRRPINGILVAINVAELIDANEQQLEATGKKLRARIDEVMTQLHMVVPVYVLFTKCDLIAGFGEFFNDLRKSDRQQAWGATLKLDMNKTEPGKIFDAEFDLLTKQVHAKALKRLATERNREAREKIYQFPLEFAGIKRNLSELISSTFQVNSFQGTPLFRGFYFTSGTQEGRPLDRVLGRMGQAMGIRPPEAAVQQVVESKSYFLLDVFMKVVFPDGDVAARSAGEVRRQALMRLSVSVAAAALAVIVAFPGVNSFLNNRVLVRETEDVARKTAALQWSDTSTHAQDKIEVIRPLHDQLVLLDGYQEDLPLKMGWLMYQGDTVRRPALQVYIASLQRGFVLPCRQRLADKIKLVKGDHYLEGRLNLKTYLMLSDLDHLDVDWATGRYTALWAEYLHPTSTIPDDELKMRLRPHVAYYFQALKDRKVQPVPVDQAVIDAARKTLEAVPVQRRYYYLFVDSLSDEKNDDTREASRANSRYPSLRLDDIFASRQDLLKSVTSARFLKEKIYKEVEGPYTEAGHYKVVKNIASGTSLLEQEQWVIPLTAEEQGDRVPANLKRLAEDYDQTYIQEWTDWMKDITVIPPSSAKDAIELYTLLTKADWAYMRILHALEDNTQWKKDTSVLEHDDINKLVSKTINQKISQRTQGIQVGIDIKKLGERVSGVPATFKNTVDFGVPPDTKVGADTAPVADRPMAKYITMLAGLRDDMQKVFDQQGPFDIRLMNDKLTDAANTALTLLQPYDDKAKELLTPLLLAPLKVGTTRLPTAPLGGPRPPLGKGVFHH